MATHHVIEDHRLLPDVVAAEPALAPVVDRLAAEHLVIAGLLDGLDRVRVAMAFGGSGVDDVRAVAVRLAEVLSSHLGLRGSAAARPARPAAAPGLRP